MKDFEVRKTIEESGRKEPTAEDIVRSTKGSFAIEGLYATEEDEKNMLDVLTGARSLEEVIDEIKAKYMANCDK